MNRPSDIYENIAERSSKNNLMVGIAFLQLGRPTEIFGSGTCGPVALESTLLDWRGSLCVVQGKSDPSAAMHPSVLLHHDRHRRSPLPKLHVHGSRACASAVVG